MTLEQLSRSPDDGNVDHLAIDGKRGATCGRRCRILVDDARRIGDLRVDGEYSSFTIRLAPGECSSRP